MGNQCTAFTGKKKDYTSRTRSANLKDNVTVHVTNTFTPSITSYLKSGSNAKMIAVQSMYSIGQHIADICHMIKNKCKKTTDFIKKNKYYFVPVTFFASYVATLFTLCRGTNYLEKPKLWSAWQKNIDTSLLLANENMITKELVIEIQKRYINKHNPIDFIIPLATFIEVIEKEKNNLIFYKRLHRILTSFKLSKLFPINQIPFSTIEDKITRLRFLRNIFINWATRYKIEQQGVVS